MWEVLTRYLPYTEYENHWQIVWEVIENDARPVIPNDCPADYCSLMKRCWYDLRLCFILGSLKQLSLGIRMRTSGHFSMTYCIIWKKWPLTEWVLRQQEWMYRRRSRNTRDILYLPHPLQNASTRSLSSYSLSKSLSWKMATVVSHTVETLWTLLSSTRQQFHLQTLISLAQIFNAVTRWAMYNIIHGSYLSDQLKWDDLKRPHLPFHPRNFLCECGRFMDLFGTEVRWRNDGMLTLLLSPARPPRSGICRCDELSEWIWVKVPSHLSETTWRAHWHQYWNIWMYYIF